jgi:hypothetical protein
MAFYAGPPRVSQPFVEPWIGGLLRTVSLVIMIDFLGNVNPGVFVGNRQDQQAVLLVGTAPHPPRSLTTSVRQTVAAPTKGRCPRSS